MAFHVTHRLGNMDSNPPREAFRILLLELEEGRDDEEHTSVSVTHDSEWNIGAYLGGYIVFENLEDGEPRHMTGVDEAKILQLWNWLADGNLDQIEREAWVPGY